MLLHNLLSLGARRLYNSTALRFIHMSARMNKITTFKLSDIGEGISEVELLRWNKAVGDEVEEMEIVCTVQSDKAAVDITSRYTGIVKKLHVETGDIIKIGNPLMDIEEEGGGDDDPEPAEVADKKKKTEVKDKPTPPPRTQREAAGRVVASPAVKQLAKQLGVDIERVTPTGPMGQVTKEDVEKGAAVSAPISDVPHEFVKLNAIGRGMVKSMVASLQVPHVTVGEDLDVTDLRAFYLQKRGEEKEFKLTMTPFMLKALSLTLKEFPMMNSKFAGDGYLQFTVHNVNVAVATSRGLLVPIIRNVESKNIRQLQMDLIDVQTRSNEMRLTAEDMKGGTVTLSNLGAIGGTFVKACLFEGQSAILALGRAKKQPCYVGDELKPRDVAPMGVTADHRHLDGATIARFAAAFKAKLEDVELLKQHYDC
ncbi:dihydrolipoamide acetyltransferase component of pyruvate dehydrogenase complex [Babesia gibsoni]|uniref:Dihydrolipoamide acetyltransferase component of pyruvate dehydrogenase complex n=1 Tax=Babesia gibsoni TaxID=33632 RepID=A0AAD8LPK6_BABGI|nr:dihydrolipoamide acetyltransferase component of pyruvate dehydrogenase complex [Babesia gibsoni]